MKVLKHCDSQIGCLRVISCATWVLRDIHIEISVLSLFRRIGDAKEIEVGRHGLYLVKGARAGLLLPQVPVEQKWTRDEFLRQVCRKAGLPPQAWMEQDARLYIFSAQIFSE